MPADVPPASENAPDAPAGPPPPAPKPMRPTDEAPVSGTRVTLTWHPLLGVSQHRVQVAADASFENVHLETTVGSENAVRVRWPKRLKPGLLFWRVQGFRHGVWGPYSRPAAFRFTGEEAPPEPSASTEPSAPHLTGLTSRSQSLVAILVLLVTVGLLIELTLLARVGPLGGPVEEGSSGGTVDEAASFEVTPARLEELVGTAAAVEAGGQVYAQSCVPCHGAEGGGGVGPNLADAYWIHGGTDMDIYQVLVEGVATQGMPAWEGRLSDREMAQLVAYIRSLEGTDPPGAKEPQGAWLMEQLDQALVTHGDLPGPAPLSAKDPARIEKLPVGQIRRILASEHLPRQGGAVNPLYSGLLWKGTETGLKMLKYAARHEHP